MAAKYRPYHADPTRWLRSSGPTGASPWHGDHCSSGARSASHSSTQWAQDTAGVAIEDVSIDLGRGDIPVSEQLLDGANVIAHLEQVSCERTPQRVGTQWLDDARTNTRCLESTRQNGVVKVMATLDAIVGIDRQLYLRKHVLPAEVTCCQ